MKFLQAVSLFLPLVAPILAQGEQANPGVVVYNNCPFVVSYYGDGPGTPADSSGFVNPNTAMWNPYNGTGRALKLWKQGDPPIGLLVWGYSADSPFVWTSLNDVNGHPFQGFKIKLVGDGNILDCSAVVWNNGVPGDTGTRACSINGQLRLTLCET